MDQQCIAVVKHQMFQLSDTLPNLYFVLSINCHWWIVSSMTMCCMNHSDIASTHHHLTQNFNRSTPVALPRLCNLRTKVWNVRKSQVGRYNWSTASRNKAAQWLCTHSALVFCTFKT